MVPVYSVWAWVGEYGVAEALREVQEQAMELREAQCRDEAVQAWVVDMSGVQVKHPNDQADGYY